MLKQPRSEALVDAFLQKASLEASQGRLTEAIDHLLAGCAYLPSSPALKSALRYHLDMLRHREHTPADTSEQDLASPAELPEAEIIELDQARRATEPSELPRRTRPTWNVEHAHDAETLIGLIARRSDGAMRLVDFGGERWQEHLVRPPLRAGSPYVAERDAEMPSSPPTGGHKERIASVKRKQRGGAFDRFRQIMQEMLFDNWQLALLGATAIAMTFAAGYTTFDGLRDFTSAPFLSLLVAFGVQAVMLIGAWLIGESFATGMNTLLPSGKGFTRREAVVGMALGGTLVGLVLYWALRQYNAISVTSTLAPSSRPSGEWFADVTLGFLLALLVVAIIASNLGRAGGHLSEAYVRSARLIAKNAMLWVMFLTAMATSVFFSFASHFDAIFPAEQRLRAAEIRIQNNVGRLVADISERAQNVLLVETRRFFDTGAWQAYDMQLGTLVEAAKTGDRQTNVQIKGLLTDLERARTEFRQHPDANRFASLQARCGGMLDAVKANNESIRAIDCNSKQVAEEATRVFKLNTGLLAFQANCAGLKLPYNATIDAQLELGRKCLQESGLTSQASADFETRLQTIQMIRDDKAHRFVVSLNAFVDGNRLAYLALVLAIGVDSLLLLAGLFGAAAVNSASPLSDLPNERARTAYQLEAIIKNALGEEPLQNAELVLSAMNPTSLENHRAEIDLTLFDPESARRIRKVLVAGAAIGAVERASSDMQTNRYLIRAELNEFLLAVVMLEHKRPEETIQLGRRERLRQSSK